jgi:hypothetical protein
MKPAVKLTFPCLLMLALIAGMMAELAGAVPDKPTVPPFGEADSPLGLLQAPLTGGSLEPILLAKTRDLPEWNLKPKKKLKTRGPAAGSGCGTDGKLRAGTGSDIEITNGTCTVGPGTYNYGFVNIHSGGILMFDDNGTIDFWAKSILVENEGSLIVGSFSDPIGNADMKNTVTFHLYGDDKQPAGIKCKTSAGCVDDGHGGIMCNTYCGVVGGDWTSTPKKPLTLPSGVSDYFYKYQRLPADDNLTQDSYFGLKTLAVSYGGTLRMFGLKGAEYQDPNPHNDLQGSNSGISWVRLDQNVCPPNSGNPGCVSPDNTGTKMVLDRLVNWQPGDWIVVTATDYVPSHSEQRQIKTIKPSASDSSKSEITLTTALSHPHNGEKYDLSKHHIPQRLDDDGDPFMKSVDTRAAVALLTRSIRIVSEACASYGSQCNGFPEEEGSYFGGHIIARQGFKQFQMKGVELKQLGQGGRMAHSPVNFHMARKVPTYGDDNATYVMACSVNESMTRMYEIRGTQGVILKRNVGYKSIGHGYLLAEGTETDNHLEANIGIYARPAVDYRDNPRKVPGVVAKTDGFGKDFICPKKHPTDPTTWCFDPRRANFAAYGSDYIHPSVFYVTNGYNSFEDNMAVGAGTCGACYWFAPARISGLSKKQSWKGYASIQKITPGTAPIYRFHGNFCSTAQHSLITIDSPGVCSGLCTPDMCRGDVEPDGTTGITTNDPCALQAIENPFAFAYDNSTDQPGRGLWPDIDVGAALQPNICDNATKGGDCSGLLPAACAKGQTNNCAVSVIDSYTSSFHWAQQNYAAVWLRTNWFLFTDSALTDVLNGGLTMVSGGSWDQVINRYWALTRKSVFIGNTQEDSENSFAENRGPVNPDTKGKLKCQGAPTPAAYCRVQESQASGPGDRCSKTDATRDEGVVIPSNDFSVYQRLYNIYDGPVYQEANAYVNIKKREVFGCDNATDHDLIPGTCRDTNFIYWRTNGIPRATEEPFTAKCIMPNAAIGWKQPNGFYYPPAFHSRNLFFDDVDIRHFVIVPLFKPGTFEVDEPSLRKTYCTFPAGNPKLLFSESFTDIDRQTELNDEDGSLSGLGGSKPQQISDTNGTISVNKDQFYYAPKTTFECLSEQTCYQSPYDHVSAVVFPECAAESGKPDADCNLWAADCTDWNCYGVPIYRQYLNSNLGETFGVAQGIKMLGTAIGQRSTMIANKGKYYVDTTMSPTKQGLKKPRMNVFWPNQRYNFFLAYAKPTTRITFQLFVGKSPDVSFDSATAVEMLRVGTNKAAEHGTGFDDATVLVQPPLKFDTTHPWPPEWSRTYSKSTGILEVTMDLASFAHDFEKAKEESCGPPSFCHWNKDWDGGEGACRCAPQEYDSNKQPMPIGFTCDNASEVCAWSSLRSECPSGGCFGFQVAFPAGFTPNDDNGSDTANPPHRPAATAFPVDWTAVGWGKAPYPLAFDASVPWDHHFYPAPGPCDYNDNNTYPKNAPLPSSLGRAKKTKATR